MTHRVMRIALFLIEAFVGVSAVMGGVSLLRGAYAQQLPATWLAGTPFSDYTVPGLLLALAVGGSAVLAAATVFIQRGWAVLPSVAAGLVLAGYLLVEVICLDSKARTALPSVLGLQILYFVAGLATIGLAVSLWMRDYRQEYLEIRHAHL